MQSLPTVLEWFQLQGIVLYDTYGIFSRYRGTAMYRDLGDTGIVTFSIAILTEVSQVSHNTTKLHDTYIYYDLSFRYLLYSL